MNLEVDVICDIKLWPVCDQLCLESIAWRFGDSRRWAWDASPAIAKRVGMAPVWHSTLISVLAGWHSTLISVLTGWRCGVKFRLMARRTTGLSLFRARGGSGPGSVRAVDTVSLGVAVSTMSDFSYVLSSTSLTDRQQLDG